MGLRPALKALELDDGLAEAHAAMAAVYAESSESNNPVAAEKEIKRAIELNPNYASAHQFYGE